jgi:hypothetical protein
MTLGRRGFLGSLLAAIAARNLPAERSPSVDTFDGGQPGRTMELRSQDGAPIRSTVPVSRATIEVQGLAAARLTKLRPGDRCMVAIDEGHHVEGEIAAVHWWHPSHGRTTVRLTIIDPTTRAVVREQRYAFSRVPGRSEPR